ncbi:MULTISPECIES: hypothetical protein [unclassified Burkholderia]|uniref:hypothetical protein n=1 Tax=unclassified Burkholderia TaxID=2613784 RepID=UPI00046AEA56|nr:MULTISPECIES: hypothetical protein [unclassified Burkholderia]NIE88549.1 hypothetical protein [Burkholderia sp. Tr-860]NIF66908.1 hypothetical protein [Burkholderia sp. Cy-647]NIF74830.1 hypothetical protein [Burkholderia sp. Ap-962]NIG00645.1 hypothetical protein [Burkholderia sp. Ax-1720]
MYVDPRVAHGRARFDLSGSPRLVAEERRWEISDVITRALDTFSGERNRRNLMRLLARQIAPRLARLGLEPYVGPLGAHEGLFVNFATMSAEHGLREFELHLTVPDLTLRSFASTAIRPHAVARCMQRNGATSLAAIQHETRIAFVLARVVRGLARAEQWKQLAVPTPHGLFVGALTEHDDVSLATYFRPGDNDRPSRWQAFSALFADMPDWRHDQVRHGGELLHWMINHIVALQASAPFAERCPFLLEPYRSADDPHDAAWAAARASARDDGPVPN